MYIVHIVYKYILYSIYIYNIYIEYIIYSTYGIYLVYIYLSERAYGNIKEVLCYKEYDWFDSINIQYCVGIDGISVLMILFMKEMNF